MGRDREREGERERERERERVRERERESLFLKENSALFYCPLMCFVPFLG